MTIQLRAALAAVLFAGFVHAAQPAAAATQRHTPAAVHQLHGEAGWERAQGALELGNYLAWRAERDAALAVIGAFYDRLAVIVPPPPPPPAPVRRAPVYQPPAARPAPVYSGGSCGGAGYADQFIGRESGGDPYIVNPGNRTAPDPYSAGAAWGCYQIIPSTWASSCGDITTYDPASQARCAARLPSSAWASSGPT